MKETSEPVWARSTLVGDQWDAARVQTKEQFEGSVDRALSAVQFDLSGVGLEAYGDPEMIIRGGRITLRWRVREKRSSVVGA